MDLLQYQDDDDQDYEGGEPDRSRTPIGGRVRTLVNPHRSDDLIEVPDTYRGVSEHQLQVDESIFRFNRRPRKLAKV